MKPDIRELTKERGISYASDIELLMLMLGSGTKDNPIEKLAENVNRKLGETNGEDVIKSLLSIKGMGVGKALAVAASIEFGRRRNIHNGALIHTPKDIIPFVKWYSILKKEHFLCITLTGGHEIIQIRVVSVGTVNRAIVHPREVFSDALKENAAAIVIAHNHPSGNCFPSRDDIETTENLYNCSKILGIELLDHIVFDKNDYFSFVEHSLVFTEQ